MKRRAKQVFYAEKRTAEGHIEDLILSINCLFPHRDVVNEYKEVVLNQSQWTAYQKDLLLRLMKGLTVLWQLYRKEDVIGRYAVSIEDYSTSILLLNTVLKVKERELLLSPTERRFYRRLQEVFEYEEFTARQAQFATRYSKPCVYWKLRELMSKGMVKHTGNKGQSYLYQLMESHNS